MSLLAPFDVLSSIVRNGAIQAAFVGSLYVSDERPISQAIKKIKHKIFGGDLIETPDSKWKWFEYAVIAAPLFYMGLHCRAKPLTMADVFLLSIPKLIPIVYSGYKMIKTTGATHFYIAHIASICISILFRKEAIVWKSDLERLRALLQEAFKQPEDVLLSKFVNEHIYRLELPAAKSMKWYISRYWLSSISLTSPEKYKDFVSLYDLAGDAAVSKEVNGYVLKMVFEFKKYFTDIQSINAEFNKKCEKAIKQYRSVKGFLLDSNLSLEGIGLGCNRYNAAVRVRDSNIEKANSSFADAIDKLDTLFRNFLKKG